MRTWLLVVAACSRGGGGAPPPPPASTPPDDGTQVSIPECGFSVRSPEPLERDEIAPNDYVYSGDDGLFVECEQLPADMTVPPPDEALRDSVQSRAMIVGKLGVKLGQATITPATIGDRPAVRFHIPGDKDRSVDGLIVLADHALEYVWGIENPAVPQAISSDDLERAIASFH